LQSEREGASDDAKKMLAGASGIQAEIDRFRDAFRKQLSRDDARESFSLVVGVENVVQFLSYQAKHDGVRLQFEHPVAMDEDFRYFGSPLKFHQVAMNLILNAIEAAPKRVMIRLVRERVNDVGDDFVLNIADDGIGMSADIIQKIFDPFFTTKYGEKQGTGIGLAITKRIVENDLGGSIEVCSRENGSVFIVRFPSSYEPIQESIQPIASDTSSHSGHQRGTTP
jgi:signal transduction histidine kinase